MFSCSKSETQDLTPEGNDNGAEIEQPEEVNGIINYFTANIGQEKNTELFDDYLIIHDSNGKLIDFKPFEKGESIKFSADSDSITDKFTVTYLFTPTQDNPLSFFIQSYGNIKKGSVWDINQNFINQYSGVYPETGNFTVNISGNNERPENIFLTNGSKENKIYSLPSTTETQDWSALINVGIEESRKDYVITTLNSTDFSRYYILENVSNNSNYQLDYNDFLSFDSYIDFSTPNIGSTRVILKGYKNEDNPLVDGYVLYNITGSGFGSISNTESLKLGYLNDYFTGYTFQASYSYMGYIYNKSYFGSSLPSNYRVPEKPVVNLENSSIKNFKIDLDIDYIRTVSLWEGGEKPVGSPTKTTLWYVYASHNEFPNIGEIPEELLQKYPNLESQELDYLNTTFMLDSNTHDEFIQKSFVTSGTEITPENIESITIYR